MKTKISEHHEQSAILEWANYAKNRYPDLEYLNGSLNGVRLTIGQATKAKRSGMKKGFPDLSLPVKKGCFSGLFIELKKTDGVPSDVSAEQKNWLNFLQLQGYHVAVCFGSDDAIFLIEWYLRQH